MNWAAGAAIATILSTALGVIAFLIAAGRAARKQREAEQKQLAAEYARGVTDGKAARDDEVALCRSQRDDARDQRDEARRQRDEFERRYNDLRDRREH